MQRNVIHPGEFALNIGTAASPTTHLAKNVEINFAPTGTPKQYKMTLTCTITADQINSGNADAPVDADSGLFNPTVTNQIQGGSFGFTIGTNQQMNAVLTPKPADLITYGDKGERGIGLEAEKKGKDHPHR